MGAHRGLLSALPGFLPGLGDALLLLISQLRRLQAPHLIKLHTTMSATAMYPIRSSRMKRARMFKSIKQLNKFIGADTCVLALAAK